jgi:hypothetical protein
MDRRPQIDRGDEAEEPCAGRFVAGELGWFVATDQLGFRLTYLGEV